MRQADGTTDLFPFILIFEYVLLLVFTRRFHCIGKKKRISFNDYRRHVFVIVFVAHERNHSDSESIHMKTVTEPFEVIDVLKQLSLTRI